MNVTVENLAPCKKLLRVEVEASAVDAVFAAVTADFQKQAQLPGFRPGKAPRAAVERAYGARIDEEVKRKLMNEHYQKAVNDQKLSPVVYPDIEEIQFGRGQSLQFAATIETAPEFELPDYKGMPVKREKVDLTEADVTKALDVLREQRADYKDIDRAVAEGDFVVVNYTGTCDGKPLTDLAPTARGITQQTDFWLRIEKDHFIPGFTPQLVGAKKGDTREVKVTFPTDFVSAPLQGKDAVYRVEIVQLKEKVLPELTDELAKGFGAESLEKLHEGVKADLQNDRVFRAERATRDQLVRELLGRVTFELPETLVQSETRSVVYNVVAENQQRGVPRELLEKQKDEIYQSAASTAKERVKLGFLARRIAEKETLKVTQDEITRRVLVLAQQYQMEPAKFIKELQKRDGFGEIHEQLLIAKVVDFLLKEAKVEEVSPAAI